MKQYPVTIAIYYDKIEDIPQTMSIGSTSLGGQITAMAAYDMFETMEIAEEALETSDCRICELALEKINKVMVGK